MKRGIFLILMLFLLVDLCEDGCLGKIDTGQLQATLSTSLSKSQQPTYNPYGQFKSFLSLSSQEWQEKFSLVKFPLEMPVRQIVLGKITICNNGGSGGIPR